MVGRPRVAKRKKVSSENIVHVSFSAEQKDRLEQMRNADGRSKTNFLQWLVDQEWERREKARTVQAAPAA